LDTFFGVEGILPSEAEIALSPTGAIKMYASDVVDLRKHFMLDKPADCTQPFLLKFLFIEYGKRGFDFDHKDEFQQMMGAVLWNTSGPDIHMSADETQEVVQFVIGISPAPAPAPSANDTLKRKREHEPGSYATATSAQLAEQPAGAKPKNRADRRVAVGDVKKVKSLDPEDV
jgi:hypothetical protein